MKFINYLLITLITFSLAHAMEQEEIDLETLQDRAVIKALDNQIIALDKKIKELEPFASPTIFATLPPEQQIEIKDQARESLSAFKMLQNEIITLAKKAHTIMGSQTVTEQAQALWQRVYPLLELHVDQLRQKMQIVHTILQYSTVGED